MYSDCNPVEFAIILLVVHCIGQKSRSLAYDHEISNAASRGAANLFSTFLSPRQVYFDLLCRR